MRGNERVIEQLNKALEEELTAIHQYFVHAEMCEDWGFKALSAYIKKQSIDEMKHAEAPRLGSRHPLLMPAGRRALTQK